jgi:hypothetical protein
MNAAPSALAFFSLSRRMLSKACSGVCLSDLRGAMVRWVCIVAVPKTDNSNFENDSRASVPKGGTIFSKAAADGTKKKRSIMPDQKYILVWHYRPLLFFVPFEAALEKIVPPFGTDAAAESE